MVKEIFIDHSHIDPLEFLGINNIKFNAIKNHFSDVKLISRGNLLKIEGEDTKVEKCAEQLKQMIEYIEKNQHISIDVLQHFLQAKPIKSFSDDKNVILYGHSGIMIKARTPNQQKLVEAIDNNDIVFAIGPAGTGKTYVAVALAVKALKYKLVKKIILTRPAVEAGENLGFLPGDLKEKIDPYLKPLFDALESLLDTEKLHYYLNNNIIEIAPLAYMRGRTLDHAYIILDEAQNATDLQLRMFLTRIGKNAKAIITGDLTQIDLPKHQSSGLKKAVSILKNIDGIAHIELKDIDVVRHPLVKAIINAYKKEDEQKENK